MSKIESTAADQSRIDMDLKAPIDERIERMQIQGVDKALETGLTFIPLTGAPRPPTMPAAVPDDGTAPDLLLLAR